MKTYIENIDLIEDYLQNNLSDNQQFEFNKRLEIDSDFKDLYEEHIVLVSGIERFSLKQDITNAQKTYQTTKWLKIAGLSVVAVSILIVAYNFLRKDSPQNSVPQKTTINTSSKQDTVSRESKDEQLIVFDTIDSKTKTDTIKSNEPSTQSKSDLRLDNSFSTLLKAPQTFTINTEKDTIIKCDEGTILRLIANSFIHEKSANAVTGKIKLQVTEYYKMSDILMSNLSTTSNGEKLETGGMIYVEALKNGQSLKLRENNTMDIIFPGRSEKDGMELFTGQWKDGNVNWIPEEKNQTIKKILNEIDIEVPYSVVEEVPLYPGCEGMSKAEAKKCTSDAIGKFISKNFDVGIASSLGLEGTQRINVIFKISKNGEILFVNSRGPHPMLVEEANRTVSSLPRFIPGKQRGRAVMVPYSLPLLFRIEGDTYTFYSGTSARDFSPDYKTVPMDTVVTYVRGDVEKIREIMHDADFEVDSSYIKRWNSYEQKNLIRIFGKDSEKRVMLRKPLFEDAESRLQQLNSDSVTRGGHIIRKVWDSLQIPTTTKIISFVPRKQVYLGTERMDIEEFEGEILSDTTSNRIGSYDLSRYAFKTTKLGWLNCDRYIRSQREKIPFSLESNNSLTGADVNMVYKSVRSIFPGRQVKGRYSFGFVGKNEEVILVVINRKQGKLFFDMIETKTTVNQDIKFNLREVSLEELKTEMKKLDKLFD